MVWVLTAAEFGPAWASEVLWHTREVRAPVVCHRTLNLEGSDLGAGNPGRIHAQIDFSLPSAVQRREIWVQHLPSTAPLDPAIDLTDIAARFEFSGGSIRNAAVTAAFIAAGRGENISAVHLLQAVQRELRKQGRLIKAGDFPELRD